MRAVTIKRRHGQGSAARTVRYLPFALFDAAQSGIGALIIPRLAGAASGAGVAWAVFYLGMGVASVGWGRLVGHAGRRMILRLGIACSGGGMLVLGLAPRAVLPIGTLLLGIGGGAEQLTPPLFVRAWFPESEWDEQIGAVKGWMGAGQVAGLLLASLIPGARVDALLAMALTVATALATVPLADPGGASRPPREARASVTAQRLERSHLTSSFQLAALRGRDVGAFGANPLMVLFVRWGLLMLASIPVTAFIPLMFQRQFGLSARAVSVGLAVIAGIAVIWYGPAGRASRLHGALRVLRGAALVRACGIAGLALGAWRHDAGWTAFLWYGLVVCAWPPLSVASMARVSELAPATDGGAALGLYTATGSVARVVGSLAGGLLVRRLGYGSMLGLSAMVIAVAVILPDARGRRAARAN